MKILAIGNQKGGVGKTTTALTLGAALASFGHRVLVMDLDPHACASIHLRFYPENLQRTVLDLFEATEEKLPDILPSLIYNNPELPFDFIPAHIRLSEIEIDLKSKMGKGRILSKALKAVADRYHYVLLDCPPHVGLLLVNALVASDLLVIPIQTDFLALHGLRLIFDTMRILNRILPCPIEYRAFATMYDRRAGACQRVLELIRGKLGDRMFGTVIDMDTKFREASAQGQVIFKVAPESRGAKEYLQLAREIEAL